MEKMNIEGFARAFEINDEMNHKLLAMICDEQFEWKPVKGKTIRSNYVHIVGVRRMWTDDSSIPKLDWKTATREQIFEGLNLSRVAMLSYIQKKRESTRPIKVPFEVTFAYMIAHEAHHRSQIELTLRVNGADLSDEQSYILWEWS